MKNKKYIFVIIMIFSVILICLSTKGFATSVTEQLLEQMDPNDTTFHPGDPTTDSRLLGIVSQAFSVIQFVGTGISIIMVMWLGITYMLTSVEEKAEIKKRAMPIVIGSVLIVATVNILKLIQELVTTSLGSSSTSVPPSNP